MSTSAVIFDMDGVLVDSYRAHFESWKQLYHELGIDYTDADFAADFGRVSRDILSRRLHAELPEERVRELDERKESHYRELIREDFPAMDGADEFIAALAADGFRLAVGSSGPPENVAVVLERLPNGKRIEFRVTGADVTRGKPDPQVFQLAASKLGVEPAACVVVEDAVPGVEAAHRAGMAVIALTGTATREQLATADLVVDSLRELTPERVRDVLASRRG